MKDKFIDLCHLISNDNGKYDFWWDYLEKYENDPDLPVLKSKMTNFLELLNNDVKNNVLYENSFLMKDIETEIWDLI